MLRAARRGLCLLSPGRVGSEDRFYADVGPGDKLKKGASIGAVSRIQPVPSSKQSAERRARTLSAAAEAKQFGSAAAEYFCSIKLTNFLGVLSTH